MKTEEIAELLCQALETEKGGIQVYTTALKCVVNAELKKEWLVLALNALRAHGAPAGRLTKKDVNASVAAVAESLRNTPTICRKCNIHPAILDLDAAPARRSPPQTSRNRSMARCVPTNGQCSGS